jgi:hypothetical protein
VNRTALAGSRYPLFVAAEYDDGETHHAVVAQGVVSIISPRAFVSTWLWWMVGAVCASVGAHGRITPRPPQLAGASPAPSAPAPRRGTLGKGRGR